MPTAKSTTPHDWLGGCVGWSRLVTDSSAIREASHNIVVFLAYESCSTGLAGGLLHP